MIFLLLAVLLTDSQMKMPSAEVTPGQKLDFPTTSQESESISGRETLSRPGGNNLIFQDQGNDPAQVFSPRDMKSSNEGDVEDNVDMGPGTTESIILTSMPISEVSIAGPGSDEESSEVSQRPSSGSTLTQPEDNDSAPDEEEGPQITSGVAVISDETSSELDFGGLSTEPSEDQIGTSLTEETESQLGKEKVLSRNEDKTEGKPTRTSYDDEYPNESAETELLPETSSENPREVPKTSQTITDLLLTTERPEARQNPEGRSIPVSSSTEGIQDEPAGQLQEEQAAKSPDGGNNSSAAAVIITEKEGTEVTEPDEAKSLTHEVSHYPSDNTDLGIESSGSSVSGTDRTGNSRKDDTMERTDELQVEYEATSFPHLEFLPSSENSPSETQTAESSPFITTSRAFSARKSSESTANVFSGQHVAAEDTAKSSSAVNSSHETEGQEVSQTATFDQNASEFVTLVDAAEDRDDVTTNIPSSLVHSSIEDSVPSETSVSNNAGGDSQSREENSSTDDPTYKSPVQDYTKYQSKDDKVNDFKGNANLASTGQMESAENDDNFPENDGISAENNSNGVHPAVPTTATTDSGEWIKVDILYDTGVHSGSQLSLELTTAKPNVTTEKVLSNEATESAQPGTRQGKALTGHEPSLSQGSVSDQSAEAHPSSEAVETNKNETPNAFPSHRDDLASVENETSLTNNEFIIREVISSPTEVTSSGEEKPTEQSESRELVSSNPHSIHGREYGSRGIDFSKLRKVDIDVSKGGERADGDHRSLLDLSPDESISKASSNINEMKTFPVTADNEDMTTTNYNAMDTESTLTVDLVTAHKQFQQVRNSGKRIEPNVTTHDPTNMTDTNTDEGVTNESVALESLIEDSTAVDNGVIMENNNSVVRASKNIKFDYTKDVSDDGTRSFENVGSTDVPVVTAVPGSSETYQSTDAQHSMESLVLEYEASNHVLRKFPAYMPPKAVSFSTPAAQESASAVQTVKSGVNMSAISNEGGSKSDELVSQGATDAAKMPSILGLQITGDDAPQSEHTLSEITDNGDAYEVYVSPVTEIARRNLSTLGRFKLEEILGAHSKDATSQVEFPGRRTPVSVNSAIRNSNAANSYCQGSS